MSIDIATLRTYAAAATPGPWVDVTIGHASVADVANVVHWAVSQGINTDLSWVDQSAPDAPHVGLIGNGPQSSHNAAYIAAADPTTILSILDRMERAEAALGHAAEAMESVSRNAEWWVGRGFGDGGAVQWRDGLNEIHGSAAAHALTARAALAAATEGSTE